MKRDCLSMLLKILRPVAKGSWQIINFLWERCTAKYFEIKEEHWQWDYKNFLEDLVYLYVKTRTFWLVNSEMDTLNLLSRKSETRSHRTSLKRIMQYPWKLLKSPYKYTKAAILIATHIFWLVHSSQNNSITNDVFRKIIEFQSSWIFINCQWAVYSYTKSA